MSKIRTLLLSGSAAIAGVSAAQAADLPVTKAAPIEYVRVCGAYGAGFFYIPGTDTCLRVSGRARFEVGYSPTLYRGSLGNQGDTTGYRGLMRINLDARTQTDYGTLRAFVRLEGASRTGATGGIRSGTQERIGNAFGATGQDQNGRVQQFMNVDKAFIQFAGLTAGRASSFFDFYAHDFEIAGASAGSDVQSTNLVAYTYAPGGGFSATVSAEDPSFRRNTIYSQEYAATAVASPQRVFAGFANGLPTFYTDDVTQRNRVPDFVGVLRYDEAWGSLQLSAAVKELNTGNPIYGSTVAGTAALNPVPVGTAAVTQRPNSEFGYAVQGGVKFNLPFIAPGDAFYLQGAYGEGATLYTGYSVQAGSYSSNLNTLNGSPFNQFISDATLNPLTGKIQASESWTVVGSYLHYWTPQWRSAFFGSYGELSFANGARAANAIAYGNLTTSLSTSGQFIGAVGSRAYNLSPTLRDNYQIIGGASVIWSPVKDLDIGFEGYYTKIGMKDGRVVDMTQAPLSAAQINAGAPVKTVSSADTFFGRFRVQRDF